MNKQAIVGLLIVSLTSIVHGRNINVQFGSTYTGEGWWGKGTNWNYANYGGGTFSNLKYANRDQSSVSVFISGISSFHGYSTDPNAPNTLINSSGIYTPMRLVISNLDTNKVYSIVTFHTSKGGGETTIVATGFNSITNVIYTRNSRTEFVVNDNVCFLSGIVPREDAVIEVTSSNGWKGVSGFQLLENVAKPKFSIVSQNGNLAIEWFSGFDAELQVVVQP